MVHLINRSYCVSQWNSQTKLRFRLPSALWKRRSNINWQTNQVCIPQISLLCFHSPVKIFYTGVLTYFFAVREADLEMDFFEVYRNEEVFWRHATPPACPQRVVDALAKMFEPDVKVSSHGVHVGDPTEGVQATVAFMNGRVVPLLTGYVDGTTRRPSKLPVSPSALPALALIKIPNVMGRRAPPTTTDRALDLAKTLCVSLADVLIFIFVKESIIIFDLYYYFFSCLTLRRLLHLRMAIRWNCWLFPPIWQCCEIW